jgi:hypothetical protein
MTLFAKKLDDGKDLKDKALRQQSHKLRGSLTLKRVPGGVSE